MHKLCINLNFIVTGGGIAQKKTKNHHDHVITLCSTSWKVVGNAWLRHAQVLKWWWHQCRGIWSIPNASIALVLDVGWQTCKNLHVSTWSFEKLIKTYWKWGWGGVPACSLDCLPARLPARLLAGCLLAACWLLAGCLLLAAACCRYLLLLAAANACCCWRCQSWCWKRLHQKYLHDPLEIGHPAIIKRSIFGLVRIYNCLPDEVASAKTAKAFQNRLQKCVKDVAVASHANWPSMFHA